MRGVEVAPCYFMVLESSGLGVTVAGVREGGPTTQLRVHATKLLCHSFVEGHRCPLPAVLLSLAWEALLAVSRVALRVLGEKSPQELLANPAARSRRVQAYWDEINARSFTSGVVLLHLVRFCLVDGGPRWIPRLRLTEPMDHRDVYGSVSVLLPLGDENILKIDCLQL